MIHLPWSYSSLGMFAKCRLSYKFRYIERLRPEGPPSPAAERGSEAHAELEKYLKARTAPELPLIAGRFEKELKAMRRFKAKSEARWLFDDQWRPVLEKSPAAHVIMVIDAHWTDKRTGIVVDFKTGRIYPEHEGQSDLYVIGMAAKQPDLDVYQSQFIYLDQKQVIELDYKPTVIPKLKRSFERKVAEVDAEKKFPANPSKLCAWCPYSRAAGGPCKAG